MLPDITGPNKTGFNMSNMLKYKDQLQSLFKEVFQESWMSEQDWQEIEEAIFEVTGLSYEKLEQDLEVGVNNGYSIEKQFKLLRIALTKYKNG